MDRSMDHSCLPETKNPETKSINANTDSYLSVKFYRKNVEIGECPEKSPKTESLQTGKNNYFEYTKDGDFIYDQPFFLSIKYCLSISGLSL
jgi:hypothetical protein